MKNNVQHLMHTKLMEEHEGSVHNESTTPFLLALLISSCYEHIEELMFAYSIGFVCNSKMLHVTLHSYSLWIHATPHAGWMGGFI